MPDHDRYERLRASKLLLQKSPLWKAEGHRITRVWIAATFLALDEPGCSLLIHPSTIADAADVRVDKVREVLKLLAGHDVLDWEPPEPRSSDLGRLTLPPAEQTAEEVVQRALARRQGRPLPNDRSALEVFGEAEPAWSTDRDERRG